MTRTRLFTNEGFPVFAFNLDGGVMEWQDWMCDSIAVIGVKPSQTSSNTELKVFSFITGTTLSDITLPPDYSTDLSKINGYLLSSDDIGDEVRSEGMIVKHEQIDTCGLFYDAIQRQTCGDLNGAITSYEQLRAEYPKLPRIANLMGLCLRLSGRFAEAEQAYHSEIEIVPDAPDAYCNLGILYLKTDREQLARTMFEKALDRDQFYLNALIQMGKLLLSGADTNPNMLASVNLRLSIAYHDLQPVQELLAGAAAQTGLAPADYASHLRSNSGILSDPAILMLMKRVENLRLNGALIAAGKGYAHLLQKTAGTPSEKYFQFWVSRKIDVLDSVIPQCLSPHWTDLKEDLLGRLPPMAYPEPAIVTTVAHKTGALTAEEFFELALVEILRDGQIKPEEAQLVFRLKNALRVSEETHKAIFTAVESRLNGSPMVDDGGNFDPKRLFKQLVIAVLRDGRVEPQEKKLLTIAGEALDLLAEELRAIISEVQKNEK